MNIVQIKEFSTETQDIISNFLRQLSPDLPKLTASSLQEIIEAEHTHLFFLYTVNRDIAGMLTVCTYRAPSGSKAWIEDVVVDDVYRGYGYGKALVSHAIDFVKGMGINSIALTSKPSRVAANGLYQALGFSQYETNVYRMKFETEK